MKLLTSAMVASMILSAALPATAEVSDTQVGAVVQALKQAAPKSNNELYSPWKVTATIIPSWSKQCLGRTLTPTQFNTDQEAARKVVSCITRRELNKQLRTTNNNETAVRNFACWWMSGSYSGCSSGPTGTYVQNVLRYYKQAAASR